MPKRQMSDALKVSFYAIAHDDGKAVRIWSTRSGRTIEIPENAWNALKRGEIDRLSSLLVRRLRAAQILVPAGEDERELILAENSCCAQFDRELDVVLLPSANCPLG